MTSITTLRNDQIITFFTPQMRFQIICHMINRIGKPRILSLFPNMSTHVRSSMSCLFLQLCEHLLGADLFSSLDISYVFVTFPYVVSGRCGT